MNVIMCYSYKGGAGRTTGAANIAAAFVKLQKNTAILDLDIEGPGLYEVFNVQEFPKIVIQDYLRRPLRDDATGQVQGTAPVNLEEYLQNGLIELSQNFNVRNRFVFLPASTQDKGFNIVSFRGKEPERRLKSLIQALEADYGIEYVVIDSASGLRSASFIPLAVSDLVLVFFRWSKQHVSGTIIASQLFNDLRVSGGPFHAEHILIPSAVPELEQETNMVQTIYTIALNNLTNRTGFTETFLDAHTIKEDSLLKWKEDVVVFKEKDSVYERIASEIIARFEDNTNE